MYYEGGTVYYGDEEIASADEYAEQAQAIATDLPDVNADDLEWLPLGVFALTQDGQSSGPDPTIFLQLAISKEGIIAGTLQNTATDKDIEIEGTVDKKSQRAAWGEVDKDWLIMETGIRNLTEDQATALLHFTDGQTQQWLMVRLEEPVGTAESKGSLTSFVILGLLSKWEKVLGITAQFLREPLALKQAKADLG